VNATGTHSEALMSHAWQLAGEARQLAEHVGRVVDPIAALPAREAAASLTNLADLLQDVEVE
jgi:hypothetical protein